MSALLPLLILFTGMSSGIHGESVRQDDLSFGLINGGSPFFFPVVDGWEFRCRQLGVTCHVRVPNGTDPCLHRIEIVDELISLGVDGIAMKPCGPEVMIPLIANSTKRGTPVVTFDSDIPQSDRVAYIGTDNVFMGWTMAKLLRQLRPEGGTFAIVGHKEGREDGFREEITKYNKNPRRAHWHEIQSSPVHCCLNVTIDMVMVSMQELVAMHNPTAMIMMVQSPMRHPNWTEFVDINRHRNITLIGADGADFQLAFLNSHYVDGLVGQLPYDMGSVSLQVLHDYVTGKTLHSTFFPTNVVAYNLIPVELPHLNVNYNLIGNLKYIGYSCFAVVLLTALGGIGWTICYRTCIIVKAAQPLFLIMVATGIVIMSSSLVPLSMDDGGNPASMSRANSVGICMSIPWLAFIGFSVAFSALFSKAWRVNQLFRARKPYARIKISERDVLPPFFLLLTCNIIVLLCWTLIDPLTYKRDEYEGIDHWQRVIATYGVCRSKRPLAYVTPLVSINFAVLLVACWQLYQGRSIRSEFSESKYVGLSLLCILQTFLTGIPIIAVVRNMPKPLYLVSTSMIFALSEVILLFVFVPKVARQKDFAGMTESEQAEAIRSSIRLSSRSGAFHAMDRAGLQSMPFDSGAMVVSGQNASTSTQPTGNIPAVSSGSGKDEPIQRSQSRSTSVRDENAIDDEESIREHVIHHVTFAQDNPGTQSQET